MLVRGAATARAHHGARLPVQEVPGRGAESRFSEDVARQVLVLRAFAQPLAKHSHYNCGARRELAHGRGLQIGMRLSTRARMSSLRRALGIVTALVVLVALPAMAPAQQAASASVFSNAPQALCESAAACAEVCQLDSALTVKHLQTPVFSPASAEAPEHDIALLQPARLFPPSASLARAGPPAYLRYHRFLL